MSRFIAIEGLDGAGKSVQICLVQDYLQNKGVSFKTLHFPRINASPYGEMIGRFLRGEFGLVNDVNPFIASMLFALDRREASKTIKKWLLAYDLVIADRYVYSNIAFHCAKLNLPDEKEVLKKWILDLEYGYNKIPRPTLSVFLNVPFQFVRANLLKSRTGPSRGYLNGKSDIHESDIRLQTRVQEEYLKLVSQNEDFLSVDCGDTSHNNILTEDKIHFRLVDLLVAKGIVP